MGKLFRGIVAGIMTLSIATVGMPAWGDIEGSTSIGVSVSVGAAGSYSISASVSGDGTLAFDTSTVSTTNPWRVADDYIDIDFSAPTNATWGLRIITDNAASILGLTRDETATNYLFVDADGDGEYDAGEGVAAEVDSDGDGVIDYLGYDVDGDGTIGSDEKIAPALDATLTHRYYSGLIDSSTADNPIMRASLAWQVDGYDTTGTATTPSVPSSGPAVDLAHGASSEVGDWDGHWYWMGDKSNDEYDDNVDTDEDGVGDTPSHLNVMYYVSAGSSYYITPNYSLVAYGTPYGRYVGRPPLEDVDGDGTLDSRPLADIGVPEPTNPWSIYVYLTGKFATTDWSGASPTDLVLPAGNYSTNISLELYSE